MDEKKIVATAMVLSAVWAVTAEMMPLWDGGAVPKAAELKQLAGIEFSVIKKNEPQVDGYNWLHGVALCWHKGRLWASYGTNRGKENTPTEEMHARASDDGGRTWGSIHVIADGNMRRQGFENSHGDAAAVADHQTGELLIMCASGKQGFLSSTLTDPLLMGRYTSDDNGTTWTGQEVTSDIYSIFADYPEVNALFFSSGRICQSRRIKQGSHYRIYSAVDGPAEVGCLVLYSDDFGLTWQALGGPGARPTTAPFGDEAKIEELLENPMIEELLNIIPGKELLLRNWPANGSMEEELGVA